MLSEDKNRLLKALGKATAEIPPRILSSRPEKAMKGWR